MNDEHFVSQHSYQHRVKYSPDHNRFAFTLLELVVATVLLAVLVTAVVSVLRVLLAESNIAAVTAATVLPESLARQLRRDVTNARSYRLANSQLDLLGYVAQDADSGRPLLTMAIASYQVRPTGRGGLLLRVQQSLDAGEGTAPVTGTTRLQPLWHGVSVIGLTSSYIDMRDVSLMPPEVMQSLSSDLAADASGWLPLSPSVEVTLLGDQGQTLFRESIARDSGSEGGKQ